MKKFANKSFFPTILVYFFILKIMKYFIVLILLASLVGLAGCFEKKSEDISETDTQQSSEDNTQDEAMRDVDNTQEKQ